MSTIFFKRKYPIIVNLKKLQFIISLKLNSFSRLIICINYVFMFSHFNISSLETVNLNLFAYILSINYRVDDKKRIYRKCLG